MNTVDFSKRLDKITLEYGHDPEEMKVQLKKFKEELPEGFLEEMLKKLDNHTFIHAMPEPRPKITISYMKESLSFKENSSGGKNCLSCDLAISLKDGRTICEFFFVTTGNYKDSFVTINNSCSYLDKERN